jgi:hypothetical protein
MAASQGFSSAGFTKVFPCGPFSHCTERQLSNYSADYKWHFHVQGKGPEDL